jgi:hypothetical protein
MIYKSAATIRAYFGVFADVATVWCTLSNDSIMPGAVLCDQLSTSTLSEDEMEKKKNELSKWTAQENEAVENEIKKVRNHDTSLPPYPYHRT